MSRAVGTKVNYRWRLSGRICLKLILSYCLFAGDLLNLSKAMSLSSAISLNRQSSPQITKLKNIPEIIAKVRMGKKRMAKRSLNLTRQSQWSTKANSENKECANFLDKTISKKLLNSMEKFEVLPKVRDRLLVTRHKASSLLEKMIKTENIYLSVWKMMLNSPMNHERCQNTEFYKQSSREIMLARLSTLSSAHRVFLEIHQHLNLNQEKYAAGMRDLLTQNKLAFCNFKIFLYLYHQNSDQKILDNPSISEPATVDILNRDILHLLLNCEIKKNINLELPKQDENSFSNSLGNQESLENVAKSKSAETLGKRSEGDKDSNGWNTLRFLNIKERSQRMIRDVLVLDAYINILDHVIDMVTGMLAAKDLIEKTK